MTTQHDRAKWLRPRFSVRTLVIVVTMLCCYAACWGPTKTTGVEDVDSVTGLAIMPSAKMPFVVAVDSWGGTRHYYFWCFGYVAKLPW
jgi:hypothetical protein